MMTYRDHFRTAAAEVRAEGRYRVFADLARQCGQFPKAHYHIAGTEIDFFWKVDLAQAKAA